MKSRFCLLLALLVVSATSAFAATFVNIGVGTSQGISADGLVVSYATAADKGVWIYSQSGGSQKVATFSGATSNAGWVAAGVAQVGSEYAVAWNDDIGGFTKSYAWKGNLQGVGVTINDASSTSSTNYMWTRSIGGTDANMAFCGGHFVSSAGSLVNRWKAWGGNTKTTYTYEGAAANTFYAASYGGLYCGQGRLGTPGTPARKEQAMVLSGSQAIFLDTAWGNPSTSYYATARAIAGNGSACGGYTGVSTDTGVDAQRACYWLQGAGYSGSTVCNLIPMMDGYARAAVTAISGDGNIFGGWTKKVPAGGSDWYVPFLFNKTTNTQTTLAQACLAAGLDLSGWGLVNITGISADGLKIAGTMLPSTDTFWTTGTATAAYSSFLVDLTPSVPEPGSLLALGTGLIGFFGLIRRRK